jgi:hypothetical protein
MDNPEKQATLDTQDTRPRRKKTQTKTPHTTIGVGHHYAIRSASRSGWPLRNIHTSNDNGSFTLYLQLFVDGLMSYLLYMYMFVHRLVAHFLSIVDWNVKVNVRSRPLSVSSILYLKLIWIDAMQIIIESRIGEMVNSGTPWRLILSYIIQRI